MTTIRWSRDAQADLAEIDDYYRSINGAYAQRVGSAAIRAGDFLSHFPEAGSPVPRTNLRKWAVKSTPYILLYRQESDHLRIVRLIHAARDWRRFV